LGVAAVTVDGKIYAIGGWAGDNVFNTLEEYDPVADKWTRKANMPTARNWASATVINGIIYAIGGSGNDDYTAAVEAYSPKTDQWSKKASLPFPSQCRTAVVNGKIYIMGWFPGIDGGDRRPRSDVYEYDPTSDTWTKKMDMPTPRMAISATAVNGKIYAVGGLSSFNPYKKVSTVEIYDPNTDTWEKGVDLPDARGVHVGALVDGKIYVIGGVSDWPNNGSAMVISTVEVFDIGLSVSPQGKLPNTWGKLKAK
jgi:N-acetylneuraminic acid mutarotase